MYAQVSTHVHAQSFKLSEQGKWECGPNQISVTELDLSFLITGLIQSAFKPHTLTLETPSPRIPSSLTSA